MNGAAVLATSTLAVGGHPVLAWYNGSSTFEPSHSAAVSTSVVQGDTDTTLSATSLALLLGKP